ncbi:hypothetical protein Rumeso_04435 [Rubellimicrobium mesophilum DSM 19309]|uniref:HTH cro/C1-type domain-containing protein n=1 Tax=Rubellimicrobium mesophilum DSM 19309 TaxID=442562 RepID=A0A017HJY6_9RHOB|nr:helix-turn-helix transcriptional regulator [Rubellimicrobium mesophilum]EYD74064.1 hypothetical protein Rumeso_04435 [Rubellimicrobium mesophilum DSM 19309]
MAFKAELLRTKLKEAGKSRSFLARQTGKTERTVSRWLNGGNPPKSKDLPRIAEVLGCKPQDFDPSFAEDGQDGISIGARVSVASHNAYEILSLSYGVTQRQIMELAPVLFSIVAAHALRVPDEDLAAFHATEDLGLYVQRHGSVREAQGFMRDQLAAKERKCFGLPPANIEEEETRNLFHLAVARLCRTIEANVSVQHMVRPDPGESPSAAGFIPDVPMLQALTGGDDRLIEAITKGQIRFAKCWAEFEKDGVRTVEAMVAILRRELEQTDSARRKALAKRRTESLAKLDAWRAFYEERHPDLAREYDEIVANYCHPDGWYPDWYGAELKEVLNANPYDEERHINDETLPGYKQKAAESENGARVFFLPFTDPIYQRFETLKFHRAGSKDQFREQAR